jgi:cellulose biosynthesis protein BcsQ
MTILVAMYNFKGGVGKTTATYNLSFLLSQKFGKKVLMVDADPQCSLTGIVHNELYDGAPDRLLREKQQREENYQRGIYTNLYDLYRPFVDPSEGVDFSAERANRVAMDDMSLAARGYQNLYLLPGDMRLGKVSSPVTMGLENIQLYRGIPGYITNILRKLGENNGFDIVFIDLNPSLSGLNEAILAGSDYFSMPFIPEFFSLQAAQTLTEEIPALVDAKLPGLRPRPGQNPMVSINTTPKFLGAFPHKIKTRKSGTQDTLQQTHGAWIQKINLQMDKMIAALRVRDMLAEGFRFIQPVGVIDSSSTGYDVQPSGHPISDVAYKHMHLKHVDEQGVERHAKFSKFQNTMKKRTHDSYTKILSILLRNMQAAHLNKYFSPELQQRLGILRFASENVNPEHYIQFAPPMSPASNFNVEERHYTDLEIRQLIKHYLMTAVQQQKVVLGPTCAIDTLRGHMSRIERNKQADAKSLVLPVNISGNHWVLIYVVYAPSIDVYYFDPLGRQVDARVSTVLNATFKEVNIINLDQRVQDDSYENCGPWVVEAARSLVAGDGLPDCDITRRRQNHEHILRQAAQANNTNVSQEHGPSRRRVVVRPVTFQAPSANRSSRAAPAATETDEANLPQQTGHKRTRAGQQ